MWDRLYAGPMMQRLPWAFGHPFPPLVRAVQGGALRAPGPVLDVGCGLGANTYWLAGRGFRATGIDVAAGAIAAAQSHRKTGTGSVKFRVDDVLDSRLSPGRFGCAVDVGCFQTLPPGLRPDYAEALARLLRPDGELLVFWVAREETGAWGPPHRLSVREVVDVFESRFLVREVVHRPRSVRLTGAVRKSARPLATLAGYTARLVRRASPQPPRR